MEIRPATLDDVERLAAFMGRCTLTHQGVRRASEDEMRQRLTQPGTDPALDTWLVEDRDEVVGFAQVWPEDAAVVCYVRVDPEHTGRGIGSMLLERGSARARELEGSSRRPRDELAEGRGGRAAPRRCGVPAAPLPLADDDRARPRARAAAAGRPTSASGRWTTAATCNRSTRLSGSLSRPSGRLRQLAARVRGLRSIALVRRRGRRRNRRVRAVPARARRGSPRRAMSASSAFARTGGARGSASRSCGRRSSSSTRAGARVSPCMSTWTT